MPPCASTRSLYALHPLRRQKGKSNALTTSGRNGFPPCLPPSKSPLSRRRISSSTNSDILTTPTKSIVRSDAPQLPLGISLCAGNDLLCALSRAVLGGLAFGVSVLPLASIPMGVSPSLGQRLRIDKPPGAKVIRCLHPNGDHSVLAASPDKKSYPIQLLHCPSPNPVLFSSHAFVLL